MSKMRIGVPFLVLLIFSPLWGGCKHLPSERLPAEQFSLIEQDVSYQVECGPRIPGSVCHQKIQQWIMKNLEQNGWKVETQAFSFGAINGINIIGKYGSGKELFLIGAHYDTRFTSDQEKQVELRNQPVPGANDGASGVALLLHLSREIPKQISPTEKTIWLVFFDLEDNGNYEGWEWILGSTAFAQSMTAIPTAVVVVDMIGDKDLAIYYELNSSQELNQEIWAVAQRLSYADIFIPQHKYRMIDDHLPFVQRGFPTALLIDFDYPYWHTTQDTIDKVSAASIFAVYDTLINWMKDQ